MPVQKKSGNSLNAPCMFILCSVSWSNWFTLFIVLTLNITMCAVFLCLSNFGLDLSLSSIADFLNPEARVPTSAERAPCLPVRKVIWF